MKLLTSHEVAGTFVALGILLASARALGEVMRRLKQPSVLGEILSGIILGPTVLGHFAPVTFAAIFPKEGAQAVVLAGFGNIAVALFLLVAGMEVHVGTIWRQGRIAVAVSLAGIVAPFGIGYLTARYFGATLLHARFIDPQVFALFFATALSISAMAVIAKTLMDLNLFRSDLGMTIMAAAIFEDFVGWIILALILSLIGQGHHDLSIAWTMTLTLGFAVLMLSVGRKIINAVLPWLQAHTSWPGGVLGATFSLAFLGAAFTEWVGVHAVFGAFIVGVAMGDSDHLREKTRSTIEQVVSFIFAPIFFATIGLKVNFLTHFDFLTTLVVVITATLGKVGGCSLGAILAGMGRREGWALGFGMNARGSMEIILGSLGLSAGIITEELFVALVVMTVFTAALSGPAMQRILHRKKPRTFLAFLSERTYAGMLKNVYPTEAIMTLSERASVDAALNPLEVARYVMERERMMPTGLGGGIAIPHARLPHLKAPIVTVGFSEDGIRFGAPDQSLAHVIFLLLTPLADESAQLELIADIAGTFAQTELLQAALASESYTDFLALMRTRETKVKRHMGPG